jgi:cytoskeletal protein CcmA (bactofilin family)
MRWNELRRFPASPDDIPGAGENDVSIIRSSFAALLATSLILTPTAFAQDAPAADAEVEVEVDATPSPTPEAPKPFLVDRTGNDQEDVHVTGQTSRTVWAGGRDVMIDATAPDAFAGGETVTLRGQILDNFVAAGRIVSVKGPVGGDVFLFGETIHLDADVAGDVYAASETMTIPEGVSVGGNVYYGGAELDIDGSVGGSILAGGANISINGSVGGDVEISGAAINIGPNASIGGDLDYTSPTEGSISDQASIGGEVKWTQKAASEHHGVDLDEDSGIVGAIGYFFFFLLSALLIGGVLLGLFPAVITRPAAILEEEAPVSLGVGFAVLLGLPVLALFLMIFILPIPLSLLALAVYVPATFLARFIAAYALGTLVATRMGKSATPVGALFAGLAMLHIGYAIPLLGALICLAATVFGLGALFLAARRATAATAAA